MESQKETIFFMELRTKQRQENISVYIQHLQETVIRYFCVTFNTASQVTLKPEITVLRGVS